MAQRGILNNKTTLAMQIIRQGNLIKAVNDGQTCTLAVCLSDDIAIILHGIIEAKQDILQTFLIPTDYENNTIAQPTRKGHENY